MSKLMDQRRERLIKLAELYYIPVREEQDHYDSASEEDFAEYLHGHVHIDRWVAVTYHDSEASHFYVKTFPTREQAEQHTIEYVSDDIFTETPIAVVDLDDPIEATGKVYRLMNLIPIFEGS